ncbi:MAG: hypothetical protein HYX32_09340 [Actinobacteria bacterium]|nr:hypothetical protein [Actinomycetota bacterium]
MATVVHMVKNPAGNGGRGARERERDRKERAGKARHAICWAVRRQVRLVVGPIVMRCLSRTVLVSTMRLHADPVGTATLTGTYRRS